MTLYGIVGALVFLFVGVPVVGLVLFLVTAPFRAAANAAKRRQPTTRHEWRTDEP